MALRPKLNRVWTSANSVLRRDPGDAKYIQGWISEIPTYQVLNFLQFKVDTTLLAQAERGIFEWGTDVQYGLGSIVWCENDKKIYVSIVGSPDRNKAPNTNLAHWSPSSIQVPRSDYDAVVAAINSHIANKANPHDLTAGQLNAYTKAETDALVAQYNALVLAHVNDKNNPHGVTAVGIGAVPITGGTYTGDVTFNGGMYFDAAKVNQISKTGGLYLQANTAVMGIDASGVPVIGTTASKSPIVSEESFPALKAAQEPSFAAPTPMIQLPLMGSLALSRGSGTVASNNFPSEVASEIFPDTWGGALAIKNTSAATANFLSESSIASLSDMTIVYDVLSPDARNSDTDWAFSAGMFHGTAGRSVAEISFTGGSFITALRKDSSGAVIGSASFQLVGPGNTWYRIAATFSVNAVTLYVNGVQVASGTITGTPDAGGRVFESVNFKSSALARTWVSRNMRVFNSVLTAKQISTL